MSEGVNGDGVVSEDGSFDILPEYYTNSLLLPEKVSKEPSLLTP